MYLKDCIIGVERNREFGTDCQLYFASFVKMEPKRITLMSDEGEFINSFVNDKHITLSYGSEVSDRDYRLAIARALAQKSLNHNH